MVSVRNVSKIRKSTVDLKIDISDQLLNGKAQFVPFLK